MEATKQSSVVNMLPSASSTSRVPSLAFRRGLQAEPVAVFSALVVGCCAGATALEA